MTSIPSGLKMFGPTKKLGINIWQKATFNGQPGFYEGIIVKGGGVSRAGVVVDQNGLVYAGRDNFPGGTFFFRGEPVESSTGLIGGRPNSPMALELSRNDLYSKRVCLRVYPLGSEERPYYRGFSEMLGIKSNPIFHVDRSLPLDEPLQASVSYPIEFLPHDVIVAWDKCAKLAQKQRPELVYADGYPQVNVRIARFDPENLVQPTYPQIVRDIRFAYGKRENGEFVGQLMFLGEALGS